VCVEHDEAKPPRLPDLERPEATAGMSRKEQYEMLKRFRIIGLCLVAVFALSAVAALSASAEPGGTPEWGTCDKATSAWKFEDSLCNKAGTGVFFWHKIASPTAVKSKGRLELTDEKGGPLGGGVTVRCPKNSEAEGLNEGTVGPGSTDEITKITDAAGKTPIACETVAGICPAPVTAKPIHLPWVTKLLANGRDEIVSGTGGEPGWEVSCNGTIDICQGKTNTAVTNVTGGVDLTFDANSPNVNCSRGGAGKGKVRGTVHVLNPTGVVLSVK
jgi:hypothetical protein